ncbi:MAG: 30S ribosomal protein S4e [Candidatus Methanomethylophilaceae archaeon]|nr:30S ribosomal protein S4e [Candidatus Methanomethylophilaceae archaeon]MBQ8643067.1 30S ribosomal protein S4e [Candidatus Methanomethylophilaceae archaeon]MBR2348287.1 30S ribosomal protein S4e [Candidatus Methanomethylophilaceae archaeon]MBR2394753.1 30S ribosomal protein S4e [Candidatus Methanomethylophilaceae archaeon]
MSDHMKRLAAPRTWPLKRKVSVWVTKQSAGAHSIEDSMSAVTVLRDMVGACDTAREAKRIIGNREMIVDGKPVKNPKAPVGFMDVISIPKMNLNYRMLITDKGKLTLVEIDADEASWELCRIEDKTVIKGGKIQLNLSGGRNILLDKNDYKCGDTLKVSFDGQKILDHYPLAGGSTVLIKEGSHSGDIKTVKDVEIVRGAAPNLVLFTDGTETVMRNCFVIGSDKPALKLPEASE